ncbi:hypothetical protein ACFLYO_07370 [Chloroflexota bacterium]
MPYDIKWLEAPYVIELDLVDVVTEGELRQVLDEAAAMMDDPVKARAHILLDVTNLKKLPSLNILKRELDRFAAFFGGERQGVSTVFGMNALTRYIFELLMKVTRTRFKAFDSREEAEMFVWEMIEINQQSVEMLETADNVSVDDSPVDEQSAT